jgi:hypothetical protein
VAHVGVDHADNGGRRRLEAFNHRGSEPELSGPVQHRDAMARGEFVREGASAIG